MGKLWGREISHKRAVFATRYREEDLKGPLEVVHTDRVVKFCCHSDPGTPPGQRDKDPPEHSVAHPGDDRERSRHLVPGARPSPIGPMTLAAE